MMPSYNGNYFTEFINSNANLIWKQLAQDTRHKDASLTAAGLSISQREAHRSKQGQTARQSWRELTTTHKTNKLNVSQHLPEPWRDSSGRLHQARALGFSNRAFSAHRFHLSISSVPGFVLIALMYNLTSSSQ